MFSSFDMPVRMIDALGMIMHRVGSGLEFSEITLY